MPASGLIPSPPDERDYPVSAIAPVVSLPRSVRLDGKIHSIRDQGFWPTCVAKAGAGIMSSYYKGKLASVPLYVKCKQLDGIPNLPGTYPRTACKVMQKYGTCREETMPYDKMANPLPKLSGAVMAESEKYKITAYARAKGLQEIKQALVAGHFLIGCLLVGDNFLFHRGDGIIGPPTGQEHGYHGIIICGFDDGRRALRIANSWSGKNWGEAGFGWISYNVLMDMRHWPEAWVIEVRQSTEDFYPDAPFRDLRKLKKN